LLREGVSLAVTLTKKEPQLVNEVERKAALPRGSEAATLPAAVEPTTLGRCGATECKPSESAVVVEDISTSSLNCADSGAEIGEEDNIILRFLQLPRAHTSGKAETKLETIVEQVRAAGHDSVRFSVEAERDPASVAVLGERSNVTSACKALAEEVVFDSLEERCAEHVFQVHFTMRETWDLPQDDELVDASVGSDWIDLGREGDSSCLVGEDIPELMFVATASESSQPSTARGKSGRGAEDREDDTAELAHSSPQDVLRRRLREVLSEEEDFRVFMDEDPFDPSQNGAVHVDFVGRLPGAWDAARRAILACEARGVYLSHRFEVRFWPPPELRSGLQDQVKSAVSHCQDAAESISKGGFGLVAVGASAFEALADNVSAICNSCPPPGWHRLEWTPHGTAAVSCHTY
jgi:hypothetical protein